MFLNETSLGILYMVALFALLWFFMIRPQQQRQKKHNQMVANLKVNDRIVTAGGIYGTIVKVKDNSFMLKITDNVRVELSKTAVGSLILSDDDDDND